MNLHNGRFQMDEGQLHLGARGSRDPAQIPAQIWRFGPVGFGACEGVGREGRHFTAGSLGTGAALHVELATRALAELAAGDAAGCAEGEAGPTCAEGTYLEAED